MKITKSILTAILEVTKEKHIDVQAGEEIQGITSGNKSIILVLSGKIRYIDNSKIFGSLTVNSVDAPLVCGLGSLLDINIEEKMVAASNCQVKYIDIESLPALIVDRLVESSKQTPEYSEFPLIKSILLKHNKASAFTLSRAIDLERD